MKTIQPETIVALATPSGRGGIAVVRVSGGKVIDIISALLKKQLVPRQATYVAMYDDTDYVLDEGIAIYFPNPNSFTGEDVLELQGHGSPVVIDLLLQRIVSLGARLAKPGEFSERAFLNGKIDLTQAEAIADLIDASSQQAAKLALRSLQGDFSKLINDLNEKIIYLRTYVEAAIDFTDEEIDFLSDTKISTAIHELISSVNAIQSQAKSSSLLREGIKVVIAGAPNVGKSTLLNRLSGKDVAIVTDIPGTTRDIISNAILIDDIPVHVIDTAGLRDTSDVVEQIGIQRARDSIAEADVLLYLDDANSMHEAKEFIRVSVTCPVIRVINKIDLKNITAKYEDNTVYLSAKSGDGIAILKQQIKSLVGYSQTNEGNFLARRRHLDALQRASHHLQQSLEQLKQSSGELAAEDLRLAHLAMCEITGEFTADDLLGKIFSSFCIGK